MRLDQELVSRGLFASREKARRAVMAGIVLVEGQQVDKPGSSVAASMEISLVDKAEPYVSRAGRKLEAALDYFLVDPRGNVCVDVGASTGGFTDCLLQGGASHVYAVDVGRGQLAERLRADARVTSMEKVNARYPYDLPEQADLAVVDVSFISIRLVLAETIGHVKPGGEILALVKPQFEAGKDRVGRNGVVSDPATHGSVVGEVCLWVIEQPRLRLLGVRRSVLVGDKGNREFFVRMGVATG